MKMIEFVKMHGLGNDYLYINCIKNREPLFPEELAKRLSNRHFGVGADGIILVCNSKIADFKMRIFNSDGSEAEMCGNGIRGFAKYVYDYNLIDKNEFKIETLAGIRKVKLNTLNKSITENITVDMGEPILHPVKIPVLTREEPPIKDLKIVIKNKIFTITCVSMGNPHAIGNAFHITSDESMTWNQIYETIAEALGKPLNALHVASDFLARHGEMYDFTGELLGDKVNTVKFDNSKIKRFVPDFICTTSMAEGLRQSVEYMLAHPEIQIPDPDFDFWCDRIIDAQRAADDAFEASAK